VSATYLWRRFRTPYLTVATELAGHFHKFDHENRGVIVRLPPASRIRDDEDARLRVTTWIGPDSRPFTLDVADVDVEIDQPETEAIARAVLAPDWPDAGADFVNELGKQADSAFHHWLKMLRWHTKYGRIGRFDPPAGSGWGAELRDRGTDRKIAYGPITMTVSLQHRVTAEEWTQLQTRFDQKQAASPLFYDLFFDGVEHLRHDDSRRAVIDFANASEVLCKAVLDAKLPRETDVTVREFLLGARASAFLERFGQFLFGSEFDKPLRNVLRRLFDARNNVLHSHGPRPISGSDSAEYRSATQRLLVLGSKELGLP
jgi:hypothetical protein